MRVWQAAAGLGDHSALQFSKREMEKGLGPRPVLCPKATDSFYYKKQRLPLESCTSNPPPAPPPQSLKLTSGQNCQEVSWVTHSHSPVWGHQNPLPILAGHASNGSSATSSLSLECESNKTGKQPKRLTLGAAHVKLGGIHTRECHASNRMR